jgi:hypothetical protein
MSSAFFAPVQTALGGEKKAPENHKAGDPTVAPGPQFAPIPVSIHSDDAMDNAPQERGARDWAS